jgi:hypothetical protein
MLYADIWLRWSGPKRQAKSTARYETTSQIVYDKAVGKFKSRRQFASPTSEAMASVVKPSLCRYTGLVTRLAMTAFDGTTVIVFRAHYTMDVFNGAVAVRLVAGARGASPEC